MVFASNSPLRRPSVYQQLKIVRLTIDGNVYRSFLLTTPATPLNDAHSGGFFISAWALGYRVQLIWASAMNNARKPFKKAALTASQHVTLLRERGLIIPNEFRAIRYLNFIGYYRLMEYSRVYQDKNSDIDHKFIDNITFDQILGLYSFDRKLRILVIDALERIEVALRTSISNEMSTTYSAHWYLNKDNFSKKYGHAGFIDHLKKRVRFGDVENKRPTFIAHYFREYSSPELPPSWMVFETLTFGTVSNLYENLNKSDQSRIAAHFKLHPSVLASWMHVLSNLRNVCAHHEVLWNRKFPIKPKIAKDFTKLMGDNRKLYSQLIIARYLLSCISENSSWAKRLKGLVELEGSHLKRVKVAETMGFPSEWFLLEFWGLARARKIKEAA